MKEIKLTQGFVALVDDEDYERVSKIKWQVIHDLNTSYAKTHIKNKITCKRDTIRLHRFVMNETDKNNLIDHKDRNGLNCQKSNLRRCTKSENCKNRQSHTGSKSSFLGVSFHKHIKKFYALIQVKEERKQKHLGYFKIEEDAARAYDEAAKKYHGEFANLNFK